MPRDRLQGILFDLGGTLILPEPSVEDRYHRVARSVLPDSAVPDRDTVRTRFYTCFRHMGPYRGLLRYGVTEVGGFWFWKRLIGMVFPRAGDTELESLTRELYQQFSRPEAWTIRSGARTLLRRLTPLSLRLGVLTNWDRRCRALLQDLSLDRFFDVIMISSECGAEKPDPALFRRAIDRLECPARNVLMIGDDRESDIEPARELGMDTLLFQPDDSSQGEPGDSRITSWSQVGDQLDRRVSDRLTGT